MRHLMHLTIIIFLCLCSCNTNDVRLINKAENKYSYKNRFKITLPKGYHFGSSIIYNENNTKIGEVFLDNEKLVSEIKGKDFISINIEQGEIITEESHYRSDCYECEYITDGSVKINNLKWFYVIEKSEFEGGYVDDWGYWNAFRFCTINNNRILLIVFYDKDLDDLSTEKYLSILETIDL